MSEKRGLTWAGGEQPYLDVAYDDDWDGVSPYVAKSAASTRTERDVRSQRNLKGETMLTRWQSLCESLFAREISERDFIERAFDLGKREYEIAEELRRVRVKPPFEVVT